MHMYGDYTGSRNYIRRQVAIDGHVCIPCIVPVY